MKLRGSQINELIVDYVNREHTNYAVLIDGEWGSGKTHFVKNSLIPKLKDNEKQNATVSDNYKLRKCVYISLYGVISSNDILKQMWGQVIPFKTKIESLGTKRSRSAISNLSKTALHSFLNSTNIDAKNIEFEHFFDLENSILIFDDLERCGVSVNEILGFINNYVEHDGIKAIIVGNQNEIGNKHLLDNLELKYLVSMSENVRFDLDSINTKQAKEDKGINLDELDGRVKAIFEEKTEFNRIKEKLVGVVVKYQPDILHELSQVITKYTVDKDARKVILSEVDYICEELRKENHFNLRTVIFATEKFEYLYKVLKRSFFKLQDKIKVENDNIESKINEIVLKYVLELSIKLKTDKFIDQWDEDTEYGQVKINKAYWNFTRIDGFKFAYDYVLHSSIEENSVLDIIDNYIVERRTKSRHTYSKIQKLKSGWWDISEKDVMKEIEEIVKDIKRKKFNLEELLTFVAILLELNEIGFSYDMDEYVKLIIVVLEDYNPERLKHSGLGQYVTEQNKTAFNDYKKQILREVKRVEITHKESQLNTIIGKSDWTKEFSDYVYSQKNNYMSDKEFVKLIDPDHFSNEVDKLNVKGINTLRHSFGSVFDFSNLKDYFANDKENIGKIIDLLEQRRLTKEDRILSFVFGLFIDQLKEYKKLLE